VCDFRAPYCAVTSTGALLLGDDYDFDRSSRRGRPNQLGDIQDWNSGNKTIAEEAIDKVKEIFGRVKFFDTSSDYPYVGLSVLRPKSFILLVICLLLFYKQMNDVMTDVIGLQMLVILASLIYLE